MSDFKKLDVWVKAHRLTLRMYRATENFPKAEMFGLTSQIRRAAASIPANIAEGRGRNGDVEFARFIQIAVGSASELEYHLLLARDLEYLNVEAYTRLEAELREVGRMLSSLSRSVKASKLRNAKV